MVFLIVVIKMEQIDYRQLAKIKAIYLSQSAETYLASHAITGKLYCVKRLIVESISDLNEEYKTIFIMTSLHHDNIIPIRGFFAGGQTNIDSISIITDYFSNGDLEKFISEYKYEQKVFSEETILMFSNQLIDALYYMQSMNVAHRRLKPHSILVDSQGTILKIGSFDSSIILQNTSEREHEIAGIPLYLSPLLRESFIKSLAGQNCLVKHDVYKSDVYSLGLILLYMASFNKPIGLTDLNNLQSKLNSRLEEISQNYPRLKRLLEKMLQVNEEDRYDFIQLKEFITDIINNLRLA